MPYSAEISRVNPTCFLFLIDRSGSMAEPIGGDGKKKADMVADSINRLLQGLTLRCSKSEGIRDYFHIGVIGYGAQVGFALGGALTGNNIVPVSQVANNPLRIEQRTKKVDDGAGGLVDQSIKFPIWFEAAADGMTPMSEALNLAGQTVSDFIQRFPQCFPPIIMNITDGEASDGDPEPIAAALQQMATPDGHILLFNLHVSASSTMPLQFPDNEAGLPDNFARRLFRMSSVLPPQALDTARRAGVAVTASSRGFVFNADPVSVVQFLEIGTRVGTNLR